MAPTPEQLQAQKMYMHVSAVARLAGIDPRKLGKAIMDIREHEIFMAELTEGHIERLEEEGHKELAEEERKRLAEMKELSPFFDDK